MTPDHPLPPRAEGAVTLRFGAGGRLRGLRQSASLKVLFPRSDGDPQAVFINTAGGLTGGDRFTTDLALEPGAALTTTTQAAERAYRAQPGQTAQVRARVFVGAGARLNWLPQEMLLFDGAALDRALSVDLAEGAELLLCESLVFGRTAMGEVVRDLRLRDRIEIRRAGRPLFLDQLRLDGDAEAHLGGRALAGGARAAALVLLVSPKAEAARDALRPHLPRTAGASLIREDLLAIRLLAPDSFLMRRDLVPMLTQLSGALPKPWKI